MSERPSLAGAFRPATRRATAAPPELDGGVTTAQRPDIRVVATPGQGAQRGRVPASGACATRCGNAPGSAGLTITDLVEEAFAQHGANYHELTAAPVHRPGSMPTRSSQRRGHGTIQIQLRLDDRQHEWLDAQVAAPRCAEPVGVGVRGAVAASGPMKVGVYVDGFNLYYGGRALSGRRSDWKWLDIRSLVGELVAARRDWAGAGVDRVVYCTAEVTGEPESLARQQQYVLALRAHGSVDHVAYGEFQVMAKESLAAVGKGRRGVELIQVAEAPLPQARWTRLADDGEHLLVKHRKQEEKGSDVNVAAHLLIDVLEGAVDAAVVVS